MTTLVHHPDCDVNDINPDGIKKPCNCGIKYRNPDPRCTYPWEPGPCGCCRLWASAVDHNLTSEMPSTCVSCEFWKQEKKEKQDK